ncbi:hypothetical protein [Alistipes dispar]|uniref:hypothetical protein n=1 Tax=Alistipes dispar TaxID=2585119 RepID=UPI003A892B3A
MVGDTDIIAVCRDLDELKALTVPDFSRGFTLVELAAEINDNDCAFGQCYVRFIETE